MKQMKNTQGGFSLVELMVVVAIIGILAAISVGQITKQIAKSRQSEAKTNLSSLYTAEKSINAEFAGYTTSFSQAAFGVEGNVRYNMGFGASTVFKGPPTDGYTGADLAGTGPMDLVTFCAAGTSCVLINTNSKAPKAVAAAAKVVNTTNPPTFISQANAYIYAGTLDDTWQIDQNKSLTNTFVGIQ